MKLETGTGRTIVGPSASQIAEELAALPGGTDSFAILSRNPLTYIQTAGSPSEGFVLEYQEGSVGRHYPSVDGNLPLSSVTKAFQLYAAEDAGWRSVVQWEHDGPSHPRDGFPMVPVVLATLAVLGLVFWWWHVG